MARKTTAILVRLHYFGWRVLLPDFDLFVLKRPTFHLSLEVDSHRLEAFEQYVLALFCFCWMLHTVVRVQRQWGHDERLSPPERVHP